MALATWWYEDGLPHLALQPGLTVEAAADDGLLARIANLSIDEVTRRRRDGHRPYLAMLEGKPAGYGWVATRNASIGELDLEVQLPAGHRYLWDFATLPGFRGRGIYPQLLAEIIRRECPPATRVWILFAPENLPSGIGIERAGFVPVAELSFDESGRSALAPFEDQERTEVASQVFRIRLADSDLDPCWGCDGCCCERPQTASGGCACAIVPAR
ncbi:MAG: GNAT family N-acetyltransferase [Dehalococcoidia bacterium]